ncbi:hypothetical protein LCGC14_2110120, partial [marine sediment metagenome]
NAAQVVRTTHYKNTLPWSDDGWRILPSDNYMVYSEAMRKARERFEEAVEEFVQEYPRLVKLAATRLGSMYNRNEYPRAEDVVHKFGTDLQFGPVPISEDIRVHLPEAVRRKIAKDVKARMQSAIEIAMQEAWDRLGGIVDELRGKLEDGKFLRESFIGKVQGVAEAMGRMNITQDPKLETTRKQVLKHLATLDAKNMRKDDKARSTALDKADEILEKMKAAGYYNPAE